MPTFITTDDVITALNASQSQTGVYRVYGENINLTTIQAHVDYANMYVSIYTGEITSTDQKWVPAKLAALCMAMIRVIVVAFGWTLYDNVNYQVGEVKVTTAPILEQIIPANINRWREDFDMAIIALMTPIMISQMNWGEKLSAYLLSGYTLYEGGVE